MQAEAWQARGVVAVMPPEREFCAACVLVLLVHAAVQYVLSAVACSSSTRLLHSLTAIVGSLLYRGCCMTMWVAGPTACATSHAVRAVAMYCSLLPITCSAAV